MVNKVYDVSKTQLPLQSLTDLECRYFPRQTHVLSLRIQNLSCNGSIKQFHGFYMKRQSDIS